MTNRRLPMGAEYDPSGWADFRVWAPSCRLVELVLDGSDEIGQAAAPGPHARIVPMDAQDEGYWGAQAECRPGSRYRYRLDGEGMYPDPVSRFQPLGPHGPSEVIDPASYAWADEQWPGAVLPGQVIYELHVGTFTPEGTFASAAQDLERLVELGVTCVEIMPVADFVGRFGWGYDGVDMFAPCRLYGRPDDLRAFVDRCHSLGLAAILDVVYNHFGLEGNYLPAFCGDRFETDRYENEWGKSMDFEGPESGPVREFFISNSVYWLTEFHFDGFRFDATQVVRDASPVHILSEVSTAARRAAGRPVILIAEDETQNVTALKDVPEGWGFDAMWNDDFHHSCRVALTGRARAYLSGYTGSSQELVSSARESFLYQGQYYHWQKKRRGTPTRGFARRHFVNYLQNHDQVSNSAYGERPDMVSSPSRYRALVALLLLLPQTPLLFQGQEFGSRSPFEFFADLGPDLRDAIREGRHEYLRQFPAIAGADMMDRLSDPGAEETFLRCKLETGDRRRQGPQWSLHKDLLTLRRSDPVLRTQGEHGLEGAVLGPAALVLRFFSPDERDRLLLVNLGVDLVPEPASEPLLAPPPDARWRLLWSSECPDYGGSGCSLPEAGDRCFVPGEATVLLESIPMEH